MANSSRTARVLGTLTLAGLLLDPAPARATHVPITAVSGSAFGYWSDGISLFGGAQADIGPTPTVTLAADASNSPQSASATTGLVSYGPARLFTSDAINLQSAGSLGETGSVTTTSAIQNVNYADTQPSNTGSEVFGFPPPETDPAFINFNPDNLRTSVAGTVTASGSGVSGSTTITNGMVRTDAQSSTDCPAPININPCGRAGEAHTHSLDDPEAVVTIPTNPAPNTVVAGHLHLGETTTDYFVLVFNEQIVNPDGSMTVTPVHEYFGYKYVNGQIVQDLSYAQGGSILHGHLYLGQVTAGVTPPAANHAPDAVNDAYSTNEDTPLTVNAPGVLANDTDPEGDPLTAGSATDPPNGTVTLNADGSFTYTPDDDFSGPDSFTYTASDGNGGTDTATVTITVTAVNDAPNAVNDSYSTAEDTPLTVTAPGVLSNDTDPDADPLTAGSATDPPNGSATLNADGSFTYTPDAGFSGTDSFTYAASDGNGGTDTATVTITVTAAAASADLAVSIADLPATVNSRSELSVTITVRNNGPDPAQVSLLVTPTRGIRFLEAQGASCIVQKGKVKALSCDLGSMASGAQTTVTLVVKNPSKPQTATLAAMVSSPTGDPVLTNNMASESYAIQRP